MTIRDDFLKKEIGLLFLLFILSRVIFLFSLHDVLVSSDSHEYIKLSQNLTNNLAFERNGAAETYRTPGYPLYLASLQFIGVSNTKFIAFSQIILLAFASVIFFRLSQHYFSRTAAYITWALIFIDPGNLLIGVSILTEALFVFLIAVLLCTWHYLIQRQKIYHAVSLGVICGMLCLVRPIAAYLFVVCIFVIAISNVFQKRRQLITCFLLGVLCTQGVWMARNYLHYDEFYLTEISSASLYVYWAQAVSAESNGEDADELYAAAWQEWQSESQHLTPPEMKYEFYDRAMVELESSPIQIPIVFAKGFFRLLIDSGYSKCIALGGYGLPATIGEIKSGMLMNNGAVGFILSGTSATFRMIELLLIVLLHGILFLTPFIYKNMARNEIHRAMIMMAFMLCLYFILFSCTPSANVRFREQYFCVSAFLIAPIIEKAVSYCRFN